MSDITVSSNNNVPYRESVSLNLCKQTTKLRDAALTKCAGEGYAAKTGRLGIRVVAEITYAVLTLGAGVETFFRTTYLVGLKGLSYIVTIDASYETSAKRNIQNCLIATFASAHSLKTNFTEDKLGKKSAKAAKDCLLHIIAQFEPTRKTTTTTTAV